MSDTKLLTAKAFCDLQGVPQPDAYVIMKRGIGQTKTYDEWHDQFYNTLPNIGAKKASLLPPVVVPETKKTVKPKTNS